MWPNSLNCVLSTLCVFNWLRLTGDYFSQIFKGIFVCYTYHFYYEDYFNEPDMCLSFT